MEIKKENEVRMEKYNKMKKQGINPFPSTVKRDLMIQEARKNEGQSFWLVGKTVAVRDHGKSKFVDLQDESGKIQLYFKKDVVRDKFEKLSSLDAGDYLEVHGEIFKTHMGETTVKVDDFRIIAKSLLPLPDSWYGLKDIDTRYRKRFVDLLINSNVKNNFVVRSKIISFFRNFMNKNNFVEVETPILQPIPGGANAKPFVTHYNILDSDFYLRIAPELYLKRLVVGGFERVYEIGRAFRNEGLSHMHNPEFTIFEFYWAYKNYEDLMKFSEEMISGAVKELKGTYEIKFQKNNINFKPPYPSISLTELIRKDSGIDISEYRDFDILKREIEAKDIALDYKEIKVWAKLVDELYKKISRPKIIQPTFVVDHPMELCPLAKPKEDNPQLAQRFQLVCGGGMEIVNAYSEQNDPVAQENNIKEQLKMRDKGWEEAQMLDSNFIDALKYGLPPTAGWGMGIDRFAMLLTDQYSIKEVIPFPALKPLDSK